MAQDIGTVQDIDGKFFAKDTNGNITELHKGDVITQDMLVFGDKNNPASAKIEVLVSDYIVTINGSQEQLFDTYTVETEDFNIEEVLAQNSVNEALNIDIYTDDIPSEENKANDEIVLPDDATAAGEETLEGDESEALFDARDGNIVDVVSDLRDAQFNFANEIEETPNAFLIGELSLNGSSLVIEGATAIYTINLTEAPLTDLTVRLQIEHIQTDEGDINAKIIEVVVPAGSTAASFTIDNFDNNFTESDEDYSVTIIGTEGGVKRTAKLVT